MHGYGVGQRIQQLAEDMLRIEEGTLYPALYRIEQKGWIQSEWGVSENNRRARFYKITRRGRKRGNQSIKGHVRGGHTMWSWKVLRDRFRALRDSDAVHREIDEELSFHLDMKTEENIRKGMSPHGVRRLAEKRFGRVTRIKELGYSVRGGGMIETLWQDLRYAIRMLRHDAPFTVVAVLTLALGIGVNTAIFCNVNGVLLQPLPYANADALVTIYNTSGGESKYPLSPIAFLNLKRNNSVFSDVC